MLEEITPLPPGVSGTIKIELLSYQGHERVAVALFRQIETEYYFGQTIHTNYLTTTTWKKHAGGWKMIAAQVLAERSDPPAVTLGASRLAQYEGTYQLRDSKTAASPQRGTRKPRMYFSSSAIRVSAKSSNAMRPVEF